MNGETYYIPRPPKDMFSHQDSILDGILKENPSHFVIDRMVKSDKGVEVYYKDVPFPRKGFPTPEAVSAVNIVKRTIIEAIKTLSYPQFIISWGLILLSTAVAPKIESGQRYGTEKIKMIEKLFLSFNRIAYGTIAPYIMKPEYMTPLSSELQGLIFAFLCKMGIRLPTAKQFSLIIGTIIQYDDAYRYRLEDIFSETTKGKLVENPYKEVRRLLDIALSRERDITVSDKYRSLFKLIALPLKLKMVKSAIGYALRNCEFARLQYDEADRYWCKNRTDYNFESKSYGERMKDYKEVKALHIKV